MLLGERNFDFIRMRRRGKVVIGHRASYKQRDKDKLGQEQAQSTSYITSPASRPHALFVPCRKHPQPLLGTKVCDLIDLSGENNDVTKSPS